MYSRILVTGGAGFIGSNFINHLHSTYPDTFIANIDRLDYCSNVNNVTANKDEARYKLYPFDINNKEAVMEILHTNSITCVVHFAAQSHVDNSFGNSLQFTLDNVLGTHTLLECCRVYQAATHNLQKFLHISTDEVYGEVEADHEGCTEHASLLNPTNPYAASKAGAEFIVRSYYYSFGLPIVISRGNNVYGLNQYPEKIIPKFIKQLLANEKVTIHGQGASLRNFVNVEDVSEALALIVQHGQLNQVYNIGGEDEFSVLEIARYLINLIKPNEAPEEHMTFVPDRLFNDKRYCVDCSRLHKLGWTPKVKFEDGIKEAVRNAGLKTK